MSYNNIDIDEADVLVYFQNLEKVNRLTSDINKSLRNIAFTSNESSKLFTPIVTRNNLLSVMQKNIESTLNAVSSVKELATEASRYEVILIKSIHEVGLKPYIQAIYKLDDMLEYIKSNNEANEQNAEFKGVLTHLKELIVKSDDKLKYYFIAVLNSMKPFDPQINMNKKIPFPYFADEFINELSTILDYFENMSTNSNIHELFIKERTGLILKSMAYLEPFTKQVTKSSNAPYEKGSSGLLSYTDALLGFISNEQSLIDDLYGQKNDYKSFVIGDIIRPLLDAYVRIFNNNMELVKSNLENAGLFSFEMIDSINEVERALRSNVLHDYEPLGECLKKISKITQSLFKNVVVRIETKADQMSIIPADNGVTEVTVDTMSRLRRFSEYKSGCLSAISHIDRQSWLPSDFSAKESTYSNKVDLSKPLVLLSCFLSDCIDLLCVSLERRVHKIISPSVGSQVSNSNSSKTTQKPRIGFFIIMNLSLVEQIIEKSELSSMLGTEGSARLEKLKKRYINYLVSDWKDLAANLLDQVFVDNTGKVASKDKDQLKEKFRKFNEGFEELVTKYKHYSLSDPSLKNLLRSEITSLVLPMYERFYGRYNESFKNPRKHIKYTPSELTAILNQLGK
ncbi:hypothetical protein TPHA_0I00980 [Tetrapisispora phaffii CBS 4417]|uniref:Exocyst complex protein EXO70 n=1 Tax=Tetrapisispora phaffii (strain ATCC 24235 / CBS 4417 / NBRC 1672 / NRRL Y-8282 / UCD 70-5) TaxID=1071381 RepID=G8BXH6_TETPH|nr:hypothetical protein TPHA_0I00980 [Tetrapisispora phaffii CBS 4417]CCE64604.1 hypothetical protein TPHA_0I00980 [Tetrapisispora phaffii CBS 4417]